MTRKLKGWLVPILLLGTLGYAIAEEITLMTYYPSPRGVYNELRTAGNVQIGRIEPPTTPETAPRLQLYRERDDADGREVPLLVVEDQRPFGGDDPDPSPFVINEQGNVGIGTASVSSGVKLDVAGTVQMPGLKLPTGAVAGHVLTTDLSGIGTWQASTVPSGTWCGLCTDGSPSDVRSVSCMGFNACSGMTGPTAGCPSGWSLLTPGVMLSGSDNYNDSVCVKN